MRHHRSSSQRRPGFTILELLVSLAIIGLLVSLVLVSFKGVRASANRTESLNAIRNMMRGYVTYQTDHRGNLLPGYVNEDVLNALDLEAELEDGRSLTACAADRCDASSYVWRLAAYLDDSWETAYADYKNKALSAELENRFLAEEYGPGSGNVNDLLISTLPSFGLNSIFLGGDNLHGDGNTLARNPFDPADSSNVIAATRMNQVRNPTRITVFASTMQAPDSPFQPDHPLQRQVVFGYAELHPPFTDIGANGAGVNPQWAINAAGIIEAVGGDFGSGGGWPIGRWGEDDIPVGHLDGSVEVVDRYELATEMSRWSPFATGLR